MPVLQASTDLCPKSDKPVRIRRLGKACLFEGAGSGRLAQECAYAAGITRSRTGKWYVECTYTRPRKQTFVVEVVSDEEFERRMKRVDRSGKP